MLTHFGASQQQHTFELAASLLSKQLCQPTWKLLFVLHYVATLCRLCRDLTTPRPAFIVHPPLIVHCTTPADCRTLMVVPLNSWPALQPKPCLYTSPLATCPAHLKLPEPSIRANDALNPSTMNNGDDQKPHARKVASPPSTVSGNTPPSTNQLTAKNTTTLPPSSASSEALILDGSVPPEDPTVPAPPASSGHEAPVTCFLPPQSALLNSLRYHYQLLLPYISSDAVPPGLTIPTATTRHLAFTRVMPHYNGLPLAIFNVQPPPPMAHVASTAVAPNYSNPVQPSTPTHSIAAIYVCHWLEHRWSNHLTTYIDITAYSSSNGKRLIC